MCCCIICLFSFRSYRSVNPKGGPDEIPINGDGPPREQVLQLWGESIVLPSVLLME